ncbi:hypothetical protein RR46_00878 [Papilio xuthus]|uniref:Uncharacterized protein n=1 Tax=Papilio xuthus TaxID=66420 RepID=A0A0N1IMS9_PAPXU|nr:hypothetical protein RR46_00878 [Papilio xuthus]
MHMWPEFYLEVVFLYIFRFTKRVGEGTVAAEIFPAGGTLSDGEGCVLISGAPSAVGCRLSAGVRSAARAGGRASAASVCAQPPPTLYVCSRSLLQDLQAGLGAISTSLRAPLYLAHV